MRLLFFGIFCFLVQVSLSAPDIPQVPATMEIAGVKLKITSDARAEIQKSVNALRASDKYFRIKLDRVNLYFPIIERVLKEEGVPDDLKYLSIQESALISDAVSSSDAVGYWQFKDFTAREVGLRVDGKVDERKNIVSATRGAAQYFKRNNFFFKNWIYSVSAYQAGPGGAKRYVDKENFGSDKLTITDKTHWYVLKYIAHVVAFQDEIGAPHSEGLKLAEYRKGAGMSIDQVARELKADEVLTNEYNKWLKHGKIPDDKEYVVIVPLRGKLPKNLDGGAPDNTVPPLTRTIKEAEPSQYPDKIAGGMASRRTIFFKVNGKEALIASPKDNLKTLSEKSGIDPDKFMDYNDIQSSKGIKSGEIYYIEKKRNKSAIHYHVAQHNESLWDISQKYGVKLHKLARKNRMSTNDGISPGRLIWLRKNRPKDEPVAYHKVDKPPVTRVEKAEPTESRKPIIVSRDEPKSQPKNETPKAETPEPKLEKQPEGTRILHVIQPGESLWSIGRKYEVSVQSIAKWNGLDPNDGVSPGQELTIYSDKTALDEAAENRTGDVVKDELQEEKPTKEVIRKPKLSGEHVVQAGESLWGISRKYEVSVEDIRSWNNLGPNDPIQPGQNLSISGEKSPVAVAKPKEPNYVTYTVKGGDSLYKIAREHDMTVEALMQLNKMNSTALSVGQELKVVR